MNLKNGYCHCGCGQKTNIAKADYKQYGHIKGQPFRFIAGHQARGKNNSRWNGGKRKHGDGYILIWMPGHNRACKNYVFEHIIIAEKALGKPLPYKANVHHVNEIKSENFNKNLVICQDDAYHKLLHKRMRALSACGHANWKKCVFCKEWDDINNMSINCQGTAYHLSCLSKDNKRRRLN